MTRRADEHNEDDATTQFAPVDGTDALLDALARGEDPTDGSDPLADLLLAKKRDIERPMPEAPSVDGIEPEPVEPIWLAEQRAKRAQAGGVGLEESTGRRQAMSPKRSGMNPWAAGLIGAAAASALIAGSGAALYNATPGSPLWDASTTVFGDRAAAVELASTLKEIEVASQAGDSDYLAQLLQEANRLVESLKPVPSSSEGGADDESRDVEQPVTVTVTVSPEQEGPAQPEKPVQQEPAAPANPSAVQPAPSTQQAPQPAQPAPSAQQSQPVNTQSPTHQGQPSQNSPAPSQAPQPAQQTSPKVQTSAPQGDEQVPQVVPRQSPQVNIQSSYGARVDEVAPQVVPVR